MVLTVLKPLQLSGCQKLVIYQFRQSRCAEMSFGNPADHLNVTQSAGTAFYIWLEIVGCVVITVMAADLLFEFLFKKCR